MNTVKSAWFWLLVLIVVSVTVLACFGKVSGSEAIAVLTGYVGGFANAILKTKGGTQ